MQDIPVVGKDAREKLGLAEYGCPAPPHHVHLEHRGAVAYDYPDPGPQYPPQDGAVPVGADPVHGDLAVDRRTTTGPTAGRLPCTPSCLSGWPWRLWASRRVLPAPRRDDAVRLSLGRFDPVVPERLVVYADGDAADRVPDGPDLRSGQTSPFWAGGTKIECPDLRGCRRQGPRSRCRRFPRRPI